MDPVRSMTSVPAFDELPYLGTTNLRHAWGVFGLDDELGSLNRITAASVIEASREIRTGQRFGLGLELHEPSPPFFGRKAFTHVIESVTRNDWDDSVDGLYLQGSSQWDGFKHVRCREYGFYGGVTSDPHVGERRLGIQHWTEQGIIGRGVLLDVERHGGIRYDPLAEHRVSAVDLEAVARRQGVEIHPGDILCIRFGWLSAYRRLSSAQRVQLAADPRPPFAGLIGDEAMARLVWNWGVSAVTADNPAVEAAPGDSAIGSLHRRLLPCLGTVLGELFDFEALAGACEEDGRYSFFFSAMPLGVVGGLGSPANAAAIR
jgi:kynurenine formamidase